MKTKLLVLAIFVMAFFIAGCDYASRGHYNNSVPNKAFVLDVLEADFITKADTIVHDDTEYVWSTGQKGHVIEVSEPGEYIVDVKVETEKVSPYRRLIRVINAKRVFTITADAFNNCVGNTIILDATVHLITTLKLNIVIILGQLAKQGMPLQFLNPVSIL